MFVEETDSRWRMDADLERACVLSQRLDAMIDDVIDDCYFCSRVRSNVSYGSDARVHYELTLINRCTMRIAVRGTTHAHRGAWYHTCASRCVVPHMRIAVRGTTKIVPS